MKSEDRWRSDPRWLEMPPAKRDTALQRMTALSEYEKLKPATKADRDRLAAAMGVGRSRLFDLLRTWRQTGSPVDLAPYAEPVRKTRSTMSAERAERLKALSAKAVAAASDRTVGTLVERVSEGWDTRLGAAPARATIRRYLLEARGDTSVQPMVALFDGGLRADQEVPATFKSEGTEVARALGDVLVVDHMALDLWVAADGLARRPLVTLAIDLFTETAMGAVLSIEPPSPDLVRAVLRDAARRTARAKRAPVRPRISLSATFAAEWDLLVSELVRAGLGVTLNRTSKLQHGAPGKRLLNGRLGRLRLLARKAHLPDGGAAEYDPSHHSTLSLDEARRVLEANMKQHAEGLSGMVPLLLSD